MLIQDNNGNMCLLALIGCMYGLGLLPLTIPFLLLCQASGSVPVCIVWVSYLYLLFNVPYG